MTEYRAKAIALYSGIEGHRFQAGIGIAHQRAGDIVDRRNFLQGPGGILLEAPGFLTTDSLSVLPNAFADDRTNIYGLLQDEWKLAPDWRLTLGVRADHFTNFGLTVNPRASLVWNAGPTTTVKALYGRAFRPPTFLEETRGAGQIALGNQDLAPETIDTLEFVVEKGWAEKLKVQANAYVYWTDNLIEVVAAPPAGIPTFENTDGAFGYGLEADARLKISDTISLRSGYAFQAAQARVTRARVEGVPRHLFYGEMRWQISPEMTTTFGAKYVGKRHRTSLLGDTSIDGYLLSDLTLRYEPDMRSGIFVQLSADNLFNVKAYEPRPDLIFEPSDIPLEGRRLIARIGVRY